MGQLDSLGFARIQNNGRILWLALASDCVVVLRLNACPSSESMVLVLGNSRFLRQGTLTCLP